MGEKPAWSFHLPAEHQHTPMQPCTAKTGDAESNQQFLSLRLKVKLNQACSGSRGTSERPKAETHWVARDTQYVTTLPAVALP